VVRINGRQHPRTVEGGRYKRKKETRKGAATSLKAAVPIRPEAGRMQRKQDDDQEARPREGTSSRKTPGQGKKKLSQAGRKAASGPPAGKAGRQAAGGRRKHPARWFWNGSRKRGVGRGKDRVAKKKYRVKRGRISAWRCARTGTLGRLREKVGVRLAERAKPRQIRKGKVDWEKGGSCRARPDYFYRKGAKKVTPGSHTKPGFDSRVLEAKQHEGKGAREGRRDVDPVGYPGFTFGR